MIRQLIKAWGRVRETSSSGSKIFIRGAGDQGRMLLDDLTALGVKVSAFIDCNPALVGGELKGVPVISPDEAYDLAVGSYFILSSVNSGDIYAELRCEMEDRGLAEGRDFADFGVTLDRSAERPRLNFKTFFDLSRDIKKGLERLPEDISLIVGVPRSGMIPAYMVGLFLNKNVLSLDEYLLGITPSHGARLINEGHTGRVLVIDDSVNSGSAMRRVKERLTNITAPHTSGDHYYFAAVYGVDKENLADVDDFFETVPPPRLFQWNYANHPIVSVACLDLDGVLCADPTEEENDDGERYRNFCLNAKPLAIPKYEILAIVTSRLEKYRPETEAWLARNHVRYKHLVMLDLPSKDARVKAKAHAPHKASVYRKMWSARLFIESDPGQAREIARLSRKQCVCFKTDEFFAGNLPRPDNERKET